MRKLLAGLCLLLALVLFLPLVLGLCTQRAIEKLDGLTIPLKKGTFSPVQINVSNIQRKWFHSTATLVLVYVAPHQAAAALQPSITNPNNIPLIATEIKVTHGPILWRPYKNHSADPVPLLGLAWVKAAVAQLVQSWPHKSLEIYGLESIKLSGLIDLLGRQKLWLSTDKLALKNKHAQLELLDFVFNMEHPWLAKKFLVDLSMPQLNFSVYPHTDSEPDLSLQLTNTQLNFNGIVEKTDELWFGTWLGQAALMIDRVKLKIDNNDILLDKLTSTKLQQASKNKKLLAGEGHINVSAINFNQSAIGPVNMLINYSHVNKQALEYMRNTYNTWLYSDNSQSFFASLTPKRRLIFDCHLLSFINHLPRYQISELAITTPQGNFISDFAVGIVAQAPNVQAVQDTHYWLNNIQSSLNIVAARALTHEVLTWGIGKFYSWLEPVVKSAPQHEPPTKQPDYSKQATDLLDHGITLGIIKPAADDITSAISYNGGVLEINEKILVDYSTAKK